MRCPPDNVPTFAANGTLAGRHRQFHVRGELNRNRIAVVFLHLHLEIIDEQEAIVEDRPGVSDIVEYESRLNYILPKYDDAVC